MFNYVSNVIRNNVLLRRLLVKPIMLARKLRSLLGISGSDPWADAKSDKQYDVLRDRYSIDFRSLIENKSLKKIALIANRDNPMSRVFMESCEQLGIDSIVADPKEVCFFDLILEAKCDIHIVRPEMQSGLLRSLYREKVSVLKKFDWFRFYPDEIELDIYEAKRELSYFLKLNDIPHPATSVFYKKSEALDFLETCNYPIVFKTDVGASASGVEIIRSQTQGVSIVKTMFDKHYINKGMTDYRQIDYGYIFFQEYLPDVREFRVIKIGDSWFGHEKAKLESQEFMSGSGISKWSVPPIEVFDFCESVAKSCNFTTMCFDVFSTTDGRLLVNELQTWFGSYNPSQMYINGIPGRYIKCGSEWKFEVGLYNENNSILLRLVDAINTID